MKLIKEVNELVYAGNAVLKSVEKIFEGVDNVDIVLVLETVQDFLRPAIAAAKSGKHPLGGDGERPVIDLETLTGLDVMASNPEAFNLNRRKFVAIDKNFTDSQDGNVSQSIRNMVRKAGRKAGARQKELMAMDPKQLGQELQKLQMKFQQARQQKMAA